MELKELRKRNNFLEAKCENLEERFSFLQARVSELEDRFKTTETLSNNLATIEKRVGVVETKVAAGTTRVPRSEEKCDDKHSVMEDTFKERTLERLTNLENEIHNIKLSKIGAVKLSKNDLTPGQKCLSTKDNQKSTAVITYCQYPPNFSGNISVTNEDYMCLRASQFLNDVMIDFFLKYLQYSNNGTVDQGLMAKTHIFTTFFFKRLTTKPPVLKGTKGSTIEDNPDVSDSEKMYERVRKWTKRVDLFDKNYIVVPINEKAHWYVCIICFPSEALINTSTNTNAEDKNSIEKKPCILVFDSLTDGDDKADTCGVLRRYLSMELKNKKLINDHGELFTEENMPQYNPKVMGQKNSKDCGIFLLQYVEKFFRAPLRNWTDPEVDHTEWFPKEEAMEKRGKIAKLIRDLATRQHYEKKSDQKLEFPPLDFQSVESPVKRQQPIIEGNARNEPKRPDDNKQSTNEPMVSRGKMVVLHKTSENFVSVKQCKGDGKRNIPDTEGDLLVKKSKTSAYK